MGIIYPQSQSDSKAYLDDLACADMRQARALIDRQAEAIRQLTAQRDRFYLALQYVVSNRYEPTQIEDICDAAGVSPSAAHELHPCQLFTADMLDLGVHPDLLEMRGK